MAEMSPETVLTSRRRGMGRYNATETTTQDRSTGEWAGPRNRGNKKE